MYTPPEPPSTLLNGLIKRAGVAQPGLIDEPDPAAEKKLRAKLERVAAHVDSAEAARLARHARLAKEALASKKPPKPAPQRSVKELATRTWVDVTNGAGVVLVDGQPLEIPVFGKGGAKP